MILNSLSITICSLTFFGGKFGIIKAFQDVDVVFSPFLSHFDRKTCNLLCPVSLLLSSPLQKSSQTSECLHFYSFVCFYLHIFPSILSASDAVDYTNLYISEKIELLNFKRRNAKDGAQFFGAQSLSMYCCHQVNLALYIPGAQGSNISHCPSTDANIGINM